MFSPRPVVNINGATSEQQVLYGTGSLSFQACLDNLIAYAYKTAMSWTVTSFRHCGSSTITHLTACKTSNTQRHTETTAAGQAQHLAERQGQECCTLLKEPSAEIQAESWYARACFQGLASTTASGWFVVCEAC